MPRLAKANLAAYPNRYNGPQALLLFGLVALLGLGLLAQSASSIGYAVIGLVAFYIARIGLENPKPKEEKKP